jgi:hypothetical protein
MPNKLNRDKGTVLQANHKADKKSDTVHLCVYPIPIGLARCVAAANLTRCTKFKFDHIDNDELSKTRPFITLNMSPTSASH